MRGSWSVLGCAAFAVLVSACCSCPDAKSEAKAPDPVAEPTAEVAEEPASEPAEESAAQGIAVGEPNPSAPAENPPAEKPKEALEEPKFTPGMSVDEAIAAVPKGWEYSGIEPDALGAPLQDLKLYEPCKLTPSQHFKLRVAIWDGKPVGIDVTSANKKLASCIKEQIAQVTWRNKVKAINTVDYSY